MQKTRILNCVQAINEALHISMKNSEKLLCFGLGINDKGRIFGTSLGLLEAFGKERVFDFPTSENAMTGISIGLAINGFPNIVTHQRMDFVLLAIDQIVNSAAKWNFMFGGKQSVPITIRLIVGKGWGQGPTHSQSFQSWFAHIPGLKVVAPSNAYNAKGLLLSAIRDPNPVIFIEHRWIHHTTSKVPSGEYFLEIGKPVYRRRGTDLTVITSSYLVNQTEKIANLLSEFDISCEIIDIQSYSPIDFNLILESVKKTKKVIILDYSHDNYSITKEISHQIYTSLFGKLQKPILTIGEPNIPEGTSFGFTKDYYFSDSYIASQILKILDLEQFSQSVNSRLSVNQIFHDVPDVSFSGPF